MTGGNSRHEIWTRFIEANYLANARTYGDDAKCPTCDSPKDCNNHYCLQCKVGGLCPITFRADGEHSHHPWLQVRRFSRKPAVLEADLAKFIGLDSTRYIQKYVLNDVNHCYLRAKIPEPKKPSSASTSSGSASKRAKKSKPPVGKREKCKGCELGIPKSEVGKEAFLVCSLECLTTVADREPARGLLQMREGAMNLTDPPLLALEKSSNIKRSTPDVPAAEVMALAVPPLAVMAPAVPAPALVAPAIPAPDLMVLAEAALTAHSLDMSPSSPARRPVRGSTARRAATGSPFRRVSAHAISRRPRGRAGRRPDYSAYPRGYRCPTLDVLIAAGEANSDWAQHGDGRDSVILSIG